MSHIAVNTLGILKHYPSWQPPESALSSMMKMQKTKMQEEWKRRPPKTLVLDLEMKAMIRIKVHLLLKSLMLILVLPQPLACLASHRAMCSSNNRQRRLNIYAKSWLKLRPKQLPLPKGKEMEILVLLILNKAQPLPGRELGLGLRPKPNQLQLSVERSLVLLKLYH